jgi:hypothetical protein
MLSRISFEEFPLLHLRDLRLDSHYLTHARYFTDSLNPLDNICRILASFYCILHAQLPHKRNISEVSSGSGSFKVMKREDNNTQFIKSVRIDIY